MTANDLIADTFRLKEWHKKALAKLGLKTLRDLLFYFPARYATQEKTLVAKIISQNTRKGWHKRVPMAEMTLQDISGNKIKATWFSQAYMAKKFTEGSLVKLFGKSKEYKGIISFINPVIEKASDIDVSGPLFNLDPSGQHLAPIYPESRGISSLWLTYAIQKVLKSDIIRQLIDPIPKEILTRYHLPILTSALFFIHTPKKESDAKAARKRFSFEEILILQIARSQARRQYQAHCSFVIKKTATLTVPFQPTKAQVRALGTIMTDLGKTKPMTRLLEGDVGSGKTYVAAAAAYAVVSQGLVSGKSGGEAFVPLQVAYMAPTEILAKQHFASFIEFFGTKGSPLGMQIGLLTGSECRKFPSKIEATGHTHISRTRLLKWIADGSMNIVIGTHALIQESVKFKNLALVIIDEQHRFGTRQRATLANKHLEVSPPSRGFTSRIPHLLSMTATPIPRTLALTIYGDLDLTLLDESPPGRKPIITKVVMPSERNGVYEHVRQEIKIGRQVYVICPRIDEPDPEKELALETKDVKTETEKLGNEIFPEFVVASLHGKMSSKEKDEIMTEFSRGEINILVATSVIEVGVNVPNATMIIIEGAERFGLAQLHQLRGRVLRSSHQTYCYLFTSSGKIDNKRLQAIQKAKSGFELAEQDLKLRGPGILGGGKQWGMSDVGMEALQNLKMVEAARQEANILITKDPTLASHPLLASHIEANSSLPHLE